MMLLKCKDCYITGHSDNNRKALKSALKKIKDFESRGFMPAGRTDVAPIPIVIPFDWSYGPEKDPNWRMQCHAWRMLDPYFIAFEITEQKEYLDSILRYVTDWWHWLEFRADNLGRAWYDMSVGLRACKIALLFQWINGDKRYKKRLRVIQNISLSHLSNLLNEENINPGNHGIFQSHGLMCLAKSGSVNHMLSEVAASTSEEYLKTIFYGQFDEEGVHQEGSFEYQRFAIEKFQVLVDSSVWDTSLVSKITKTLKKAKLNYYWMVYPNGHEVPVGDTDGSFVGVKDIEVSNKKIWKSSSGYNVFKNQVADCKEQSYLIFLTNNKNQIHGHDDFGSIVLWDLNKPMLIDPGKYGYVKDSFRKYFVSSEAHNVARVRQADYSDATCKIVEFDFYEESGNIIGYLFLKAKNKNGNLFRQTRIILLRPRECFFVKDFFLSEEVEFFDVNWHCDEKTIFKDDLRKSPSEFNLICSVQWGGTQTFSVEEFVMDEKNLAGLSSVGGEYKSIHPCKTIKSVAQGLSCTVDSFFCYNNDIGLCGSARIDDFEEKKKSCNANINALLRNKFHKR